MNSSLGVQLILQAPGSIPVVLLKEVQVRLLLTCAAIVSQGPHSFPEIHTLVFEDERFRKKVIWPPLSALVPLVLAEIRRGAVCRGPGSRQSLQIPNSYTMNHLS